MTTDPMKQYFDSLRRDIQVLKDRRTAIDHELSELEGLETFLVGEHSNPNIQLMVKRLANPTPTRDAEEEPEALEEDEKARVNPMAAVRLMFHQPGTTLSKNQVHENLEHMRQQGLIETTSAGFDSDRVNKILRTLRDQGFLKRVEGDARSVNKSYIRA